MKTAEQDVDGWIADDERGLAEARRVLVEAGVMEQVAAAAVNWMAEHENAAKALTWAKEQAATKTGASGAAFNRVAGHEGEIKAAVASAGRGAGGAGGQIQAKHLTDEEIRVVSDLAKSSTDPMRRTRARLVQHELLLAGEADAYEAGDGAGHRRKAWAMARPLFARR